MATYIYVLENQSAKLVGLAQGIQGTLALSSVPAGWVADKFRRDNVLKCCALADIGAIVCTTCAILLPETLTIPIFGAVVHTKFLWLCIALALWGLGQGAGPVSEALLADSTCTGSRAKVYSLVYSAGLTGMAFGPLTAAAAFAVTDNKWQISTLQHVILIGLVLALVPIVSLFCFDDDKALGEESDAAKYEPLAVQDIASDDATEVSQDKLQTITSRWATPQLNTHSVPYLLATSDLVFGLATGMTIKFFPIFFLKQVGLAPIATNFVMAATPLAVAAVAAGSPQLANVIGRVQTILLFKLCAVALLALIGWFPGVWTKLSIIIPAYVVRTAIMDSAFPLQKSILMDYVSKGSRARWNSLDGVLIFGWSGTALLGGMLIDKIGFGGAFCLTALTQCIGVCFLLPLLFIVPKHQAGHLLNRSGLTAYSVTPELGSHNVMAVHVDLPVEQLQASSQTQQSRATHVGDLLL
ncbi:hypothetical protein WJX77_007083 [Trebouxia sp. C0004]